jgi:(p)ppGpp synthase/HD superfamily hydrolase
MTSKERVIKATDLINKKLRFNSDDAIHALRVANYAVSNQFCPKEIKLDCYAVALCHDLVEDGYCTEEEIKETFGGDALMISAIDLLTHDKKTMSYESYIKRIKNYSFCDRGIVAYWVKIADMKDHLMQTETLTDKLKEKYLLGLKELL